MKKRELKQQLLIEKQARIAWQKECFRVCKQLNSLPFSRDISGTAAAETACVTCGCRVDSVTGTKWWMDSSGNWYCLECARTAISGDLIDVCEKIKVEMQSIVENEPGSEDGFRWLPRVVQERMDELWQLRANQRVNASEVYGFMTVVSLLGDGEISSGRFRECLAEWVKGRREWTPADFGFEEWPTPGDQAKAQIVELKAEVERLEKRLEVPVDVLHRRIEEVLAKNKKLQSELDAMRPVVEVVDSLCAALRRGDIHGTNGVWPLLHRLADATKAPDTGLPIREGDVWRHAIWGDQKAQKVTSCGWKMGSEAYMFECPGDWIFVRRGGK